MLPSSGRLYATTGQLYTAYYLAVWPNSKAKMGMKDHHDDGIIKPTYILSTLCKLASRHQKTSTRSQPDAIDIKFY